MKHPLQTYLDANDVSHAAFAGRVDTTRQTVFRICKGRNKPSPDLALKIVSETAGEVTLSELFGEVAA